MYVATWNGWDDGYLCKPTYDVTPTVTSSTKHLIDIVEGLNKYRKRSLSCQFLFLKTQKNLYILFHFTVDHTNNTWHSGGGDKVPHKLLLFLNIEVKQKVSFDNKIRL